MVRVEYAARALRPTGSRQFFGLVLLLAFLWASSPACGGQQAPLTLRVDATKPAAYKIPRSIFGAFREPIGNSIYNALWAELLENPSFEDNLWSAPQVLEMIHDRPELGGSSELALPLPWEPLDRSQGARHAPEWDDAANSSRSLLLMSLPDGATGVRQRIYPPVPHVTFRKSLS